MISTSTMRIHKTQIFKDFFNIMKINVTMNNYLFIICSKIILSIILFLLFIAKLHSI